MPTDQDLQDFIDAPREDADDVRKAMGEWLARAAEVARI